MSPTRDQRSDRQHPAERAERSYDSPMRVRFEWTADFHPRADRGTPEGIECDASHERRDRPCKEHEWEREYDTSFLYSSTKEVSR